MMIYYEVNLKIENGIHGDFRKWLTKHINDVLQFPGFETATVALDETNSSDSHKGLHVLYQVKDQASIDNYLTNGAPKMRQEGIDKFGEHFSATRRIMEVDEVFG